jgi:4-diphosphocytidyl-2-C-methyl-D-erythritol kinase
MTATRRVRVRALAKINLDLRVLGKRDDGYHELRTVFQTISLADTIDIAFTPGAARLVELEETLPIPDNLVERAARLVLEESGARGVAAIRLAKRIPMGAGLGGGSSDAAAILLALPVLTGRPIAAARLCELGRQLGSDVPFFLLGGTAVGIGRGTEVFPLPDRAVRQGLLVTPDIHVSTADAYRWLAPRLTTESQQNKIFSFQTQAWLPSGEACSQNDFEPVVMERHTHLAQVKKRLVQAGASAAMMSGSGSAFFGLFPDRNRVSRAIELLGDERTFRISLVSRSRYRSLWWRALKDHMNGRVWPPRSRYKQ